MPDRLLVFAVIEGSQRRTLGLLAGALDDPKSRELYASLATAEVRHRDIFMRSRAGHGGLGERRARAGELAATEATIFDGRPITAQIHG